MSKAMTSPEVTFQLQPYPEVARQVAGQLGATWKSTHFEFASAWGAGTVEAHGYDDFSIMLSQISFLRDTRLSRTRSALKEYIAFDFISDDRTGVELHLSSPSLASCLDVDQGVKHEQFAILARRSWLESFFKSPMPHLLRQPDDPLYAYRRVNDDLSLEWTLLIQSQRTCPYRKAYLYAKAVLLLSCTLAGLQEEAVKPGYRPLHPDDLQAIRRVEAFIRENLHQRVTIPKLSHRFNLNREKIQSLFKRVYGTGLASYARHLRMKEAATQLRTGKSVTEVGFSLGYSNLSHFAKTFRKVHGCTPSDYQAGRNSDYPAGPEG